MGVFGQWKCKRSLVKQQILMEFDMELSREGDLPLLKVELIYTRMLGSLFFLTRLVGGDPCLCIFGNANTYMYYIALRYETLPSVTIECAGRPEITP
jgi:hypothetical protein